MMKFSVYTTGLFLMTYLVLASLAEFMTKRGPYPYTELMWLSLLFMAFSTFLPGLKNAVFAKKISIRQHADILVVFVATLALSIFFVNTFSLWLDEHLQGQYSATWLPVAAGTIQHQPPADMVFTNFGLWLLGVSVFGLRIHAVFFSAAAATALYTLTKYLSCSRLLAGFCTLFFIFHHLVFKYGYEARPVSLGLFTELLFVAAILAQLEEKSDIRNEHRFVGADAWLTGITFLYLSVLGMQPAFIVGLTIAYFSLLGLFYRKFFKPALLILAGLLLYLPLQIIILKMSPPRFNVAGAFDLGRILGEMQLSNFSVLNIYLNPIGLCILVGLVFYFMKFKKLDDIKLSFLIFLSVFFPLTLIPYFKAQIEWDLMPHYLISLLPLLFLLLSALWGHLSAVIKPKKLNTVATIIIFGIAALTFDFKDRKGSLQNDRQDLKAAYKLISEDKKAGDLVLSFCLNSENFCVEWPVAKPFYLNDAPLEKARTPSVEVYKMSLNAKVTGQNIYFIYQNDWSAVDPGEKNLIGKFNKVSVYRLPCGDNAAKAVIEFFNPFVQSALQQNRLLPEAIAYLIVSYEYLGDVQMKNKLIEIHKKLKTKNTAGNKYMEMIAGNN
jgi:hypothetical protein